MKERIASSKYFKPLSFSIFFVLIFSLAIYLTFPVDGVKERIISGIEANTPFEAKIGSLSFKPIFSFDAHDLRLYKEGEVFIDLADLRVSPSLLSIFSSGLILPFSVHLLGGEVKGKVVYNYDTKQIESVEAKLNSLNVQSLPSSVTAYLGMKKNNLRGLLNGNLSLDFIPETEGDFSFEVDELGIDNINLRGFPVPPLNNLESSFRGRIENGITKVDELKFWSKDFDLNFVGTMPILWKITRGGKIDLMVNLNILSEEAKLGIIKSFLAPQRDGTLGGKILGTIGNPKVIKDSAGVQN